MNFTINMLLITMTFTFAGMAFPKVFVLPARPAVQRTFNPLQPQSQPLLPAIADNPLVNKLAKALYKAVKDEGDQNQPNTQPNPEKGNPAVSQWKKQIKIEMGDITTQEVEVIVNAANEQLAAGGGVCGEIFRAAGMKELQRACDSFPSVRGVRCPTGEARITPSFKLTEHGTTHIIHAVGPDCRIIKNTADRKRLLYSTYKNSLQLAVNNALKSIAFPFISSAIYACPKDLAAQTALEAVRDFLQARQSSLKQVVFVLFSAEDYTLFNKALGSLS